MVLPAERDVGRRRRQERRGKDGVPDGGGDDGGGAMMRMHTDAATTATDAVANRNEQRPRRFGRRSRRAVASRPNLKRVIAYIDDT